MSEPVEGRRVPWRRLAAVPGALAVAVLAGGLLAGAASAQIGAPPPPVEAERAPPPTEPSIPVPQKAQPEKPQAKPQPRGHRYDTSIRRPGKRTPGPLALPPPAVLAMMVRSTLAGLNHANFTQNYSVLLGLATPTLRKRVSVAQLAQAFAGLRKQNLDLSPALIVAPQWTSPPIVTREGELRIAGVFATQPQQIAFEIAYQPFDGIWLVDKLSVTAKPVAPAAAPAAEGAPVAAGPPPAPSAGAPKAAAARAPPASRPPVPARAPEKKN